MDRVATKGKFTSYQVWVIIVLAMTQFTVVLDFMVMSPLGDMLKKAMDLNPSQFSMVVAVYAFSAGSSGFLTAGFADRFDRKKLLLFFYIGFILGTLLCGLVSSYWLLLLARIITGIFGGVIGSISMAIIADIFAENQRGRVIGFLQMGFGVSQVMGIPISLFIANSWGWQSPFFMIVILAAMVCLVAIIKMKPIRDHLAVQEKENPLKHLWNTLMNRRYRSGFLATACLSLGGWMMMPWGSVYSINNLGITETELPMLFLIGGITTLIIMPITGKLSDRMDRMKLYAYASVWMAVTVIVYCFMGRWGFYLVALVNMLMMIGIMSRMVPANAMIMGLPGLKDRGAFMSVNSSLQQLSGGLATSISGMIVVQQSKDSPLEHFDWLGYLVVLIILLNIYFMYRVKQHLSKA
ncbi:MAG: MFS transporter [Bacteroidetes bacterium]|nr:MAG: MFS transporter [Bacteroidota bacterium]